LGEVDPRGEDRTLKENFRNGEGNDLVQEFVAPNSLKEQREEKKRLSL